MTSDDDRFVRAHTYLGTRVHLLEQRDAVALCGAFPAYPWDWKYEPTDRPLCKRCATKQAEWES